MASTCIRSPFRSLRHIPSAIEHVPKALHAESGQQQQWDSKPSLYPSGRRKFSIRNRTSDHLAQSDHTTIAIPTLASTRHVSHFNRTSLPARVSIESPGHHARYSTRQPSVLVDPLEMASSTKVVDDHYLTLSCPDKSGIVHAVTGILASFDLTIVDLQQFSDPVSKTFFMRVHFGYASDLTSLHEKLIALGEGLKVDYEVRRVDEKPRVLIMVSKIGHCLNDLLYRVKSGQLKIKVPVIVSNHPEFADLAKSYGIPFHHLPVTKDTKTEQENQILALCKEHNIDLIVLARYMQVLSPGLCTAMSGRIINIHHSFLPSFKGAKPYHQAYERGVKIIGASAHFVTADLDEGPIIEQRVARVDHGMGPKELVEEGSNVESQVLAAAVKWWSEKRVFLNGGKTVVFN
ncbi:Formyltetrahydrofolate deformylase [Amniculicola lignicola CBS 123094]|uniref:Formyltetrahydrofolate deformylase n=1 Tax=Amniculicola lignicola CBS 123094 TaxID=1392246 RepID=A0A6A5WE97_9PLEO|nr:Formyltetrahydrofolate deformylase [Amniculicola lignicola CBS 123094]